MKTKSKVVLSRKATLFALTIAFVLSVLAGSISAFSDVEGHWAQETIEQMAEKSVVAGYPDGTFRPDDKITRAEAVQLLQNMYRYPVEITGEFTDVAEDSWYAEAVYALKGQGLVNGVRADSFSPAVNITRQDTALIMARLIGMDSAKDYTGALQGFDDGGEVAEYARNAVGYLAECQVMLGRDGSSLAPHADISRAEFLQLLYRADQALKNVAEPETPKTDVPSGSGSSGGSGGGRTEPQIVIDEARSGIVEVYGIHYAVLVFEKKPADPTYRLSGNPLVFPPSDVNKSGDIVKIQLPDGASRTLSVSSGKETVIIQLDALGSSKLVKKEVNAQLTSDNREPYIVLTQETISLEQYLKFIKVGGQIYIKSEDNRVATSVLRMAAADAVSSATKNVPPDLQNVTVDACIAVQFDMLANNFIAQTLGIPGSKTAALLEKWECLQKGIVLNKAFTLYADELGEVVDREITTAALPKYIKYLTSSGQYGTKVRFDTHLPDSETPPEIAISRVMKGSDILAVLSEENETWYRYLTEISIPHTASQTYFYHQESRHALAASGTEITLMRGFGPTENAGSYEVTFKSVGFEDVTVSFAVVDYAPTVFTPTWNNAEGRLELKPNFTYYFNRFEMVKVNGVELTEEDGIEVSAFYNLYIPYKYLTPGENTLEFICAGFEDKEITIQAPDGFVTPKSAPTIEMEYVLGGTKTLSFRYEETEEESEQEEWLDSLTAGSFSIKYSSYGTYTVTGMSIDRDERRITVQISNSSGFSVYYDAVMTIAVPEYEIVKTAFKPVTAVPNLTSGWTNGNDYKIVDPTNATYSTYFTNVEVKLGDTVLIKGSDYVLEGNALVIYAQNFEPGTHTATLTASGYPVHRLTIETPEGFVTPMSAPALSAEAVLEKKPVIIDFEGDEAWGAAIQKVTVQTSLAASPQAVTKYEIKDGKLVVTDSKFNYSGSYIINVYSAGYRNTSVTAVVVKEAAVTLSYEEADCRWRIKSADSSFLSAAAFTVELNGNALVKDTDYIIKLYYDMYIDVAHFTEPVNTLTITANGYMPITLEVESKPIPAAAPQLELRDGMVLTTDKAIVIYTEDAAWLSGVTKSNVSIAYGTYGSVSVTGIVTDIEAGTLTINFTSTLSYSNTYEISVKTAGYRAASLQFKPFTPADTLSYAWNGDGSLTIKASKTSSTYLDSSASVYVNGRLLEKTSDYTSGYDASWIDYITVKAPAFSEAGEYEIEIRNGSKNYLPVILTVTKN